MHEYLSFCRNLAGLCIFSTKLKTGAHSYTATSSKQHQPASRTVITCLIFSNQTQKKWAATKKMTPLKMLWDFFHFYIWNSLRFY